MGEVIASDTDVDTSPGIEPGRHQKVMDLFKGMGQEEGDASSRSQGLEEEDHGDHHHGNDSNEDGNDHMDENGKGGGHGGVRGNSGKQVKNGKNGDEMQSVTEVESDSIDSPEPAVNSKNMDCHQDVKAKADKESNEEMTESVESDESR